MQALNARTGKELTVPLADLPLHHGPVDAGTADAAASRGANGYLTPRLTIGASLAAICFGAVAVNSAVHPGTGWTGALAPAAIALLCVALIIALPGFRR